MKKKIIFNVLKVILISFLLIDDFYNTRRITLLMEHIKLEEKNIKYLYDFASKNNEIWEFHLKHLHAPN